MKQNMQQPQPVSLPQILKPEDIDSDLILPRKLVVYSDNLKDNEPRSHQISQVRGSIEDIEMALRDTFNMSLMASTSFRFDPELNLLEVPDPRFPRWTAIKSSHDEVTIEAKMFVLANGYDTNDVPFPYLMRQALSGLERQMGIRRVDLLILSFSGISICELEKTEESVSGFSKFVDRMLDIWEQCIQYQKSGRIFNLGVTNFSPWQMDLFLEKVNIKLAMNQIRLKKGEDMPQEILDHAKEHGYEVSQHNVSTDPLTDMMFAEMNRDYLINQRFPTIEIPAEGAMVDIMYPRWVVKYSVVHNEDQVVESRGYIGMTSSDTGRDPDQI